MRLLTPKYREDSSKYDEIPQTKKTRNQRIPRSDDNATRIT